MGKYKLLYKDEKYYDISNADTTQVTTDHMVIKLKDEITEAERESFNSRYPITFSHSSHFGTNFYYINEEADFIEWKNDLANASEWKDWASSLEYL